jgi:hypothetical protein
MHSDWLEAALRRGDFARILYLLIPEVKRNLACAAAILITTVSFQFQLMPLLKRAAPFDDDDWIFELKYDGFRALAVIEHGQCPVVLTQCASVRVVFCTRRINLLLPAECETGH